MKIILEYLKYYIDMYNKSLKLEDKILILNSINTLFFVSGGNNKEINKLYDDFTKDKEDIISLVNEYNNNINKNSFMSKDDIAFLYEIVQKININDSIPSSVNANKNDMNYLFKYLKNNIDYTNLITYLNGKTIYDISFNASYMINLYNNDLVIINSDNIIDYIHEITHVYTKKICNYYKETPSIMMEMALQSFYKIGDKNNRIDNLYNIHSCSINDILRYANVYTFQNELIYYLGTLIAMGFIYKNGNNFETIKLGVDTLCNNSNSSVKDMLNILNISEQDIIKSFNVKRKILCKQ